MINSVTVTCGVAALVRVLCSNPDRWLAVTVHLEGPATDQIYQMSPWFLFVVVQDATKIPFYSACYWCSLFKVIKKEL